MRLTSDPYQGVQKEYFESDNLIPTGNSIMGKVVFQFIKPEQHSFLERYGLISLKVCTVIACFASQWPSVLAASKISDKWHWKILFGGGELAAWGAVYSACSLEIIDEISSERDVSKVTSTTNPCLKTAYWVSIICLAILVQASDIYISYKYTDQTLFWPIYVGIIYSAFTINSLHKAIKFSTRTSNVFSRCIIQDSRKIDLLETKKKFTENLEAFIQYIQGASSQVKSEFLSLLDNARSSSNQANLFKYMLSHGTNERLKRIQSETQNCHRGAQAMQWVGLLFYTANLYLDVLLDKEAAKLVLNSPYLIGIFIFFSSAPDVFLDLEMSCGTIRDLYWGIWNFYKHCKNVETNIWNRASMYKVIAHISTIAFSVFGLGSTFTIANDTIGFKKNPLVCSTILVFTSLLTANGLKTLHNNAVDWALFFYDDNETQRVKKTAWRLKHLTKELSIIKCDQFNRFYNVIYNEDRSPEELV